MLYADDIVMCGTRIHLVENKLENIRESAEVVWACIETRRRICGQLSDGDGGAGEKKERKTEAEVVG